MQGLSLCLFQERFKMKGAGGIEHEHTRIKIIFNFI